MVQQCIRTFELCFINKVFISSRANAIEGNSASCMFVVFQSVRVCKKGLTLIRAIYITPDNYSMGTAVIFLNQTDNARI
jgi:hypothetical protein